MQPGVLRTLEFDRIVEAVRGFAVTPMGDERLARLAAVDRPRDRGAVACGDERNGGVHRQAGRLPAAGGRRSSRDSGLARRRGPAARGAATAGARHVSRVDRRDAGGHSARRRDLSRSSIRRVRRWPRSRAKSPRCATRSTRRATSSTTPAPSCASSATSSAGSGPGCVARSSPTCAARTPRNTCRTRS